MTPVGVAHWTSLNKNTVVGRQTHHLILHKLLQGFKPYNSFKIRSQNNLGKKTSPLSSNNNNNIWHSLLDGDSLLGVPSYSSHLPSRDREFWENMGVHRSS